MSVSQSVTHPFAPGSDPYRLGRGHGGEGHIATGHGEGGPAPKRVVVGFGFWIFILSDIVMFSAFFAAHAVLEFATAGGPSGHELFNPTSIAIETGFLLTSSFACGLSAVATQARSLIWTEVFLLITGLLGLGFLVFEARDFAGMVAAGAGPDRSAFLSSFFAVVGCHGLHVTAGLLWLGTMMAQVFVKGFRPNVLRRLLCFNLFWHALDIIWVAIPIQAKSGHSFSLGHRQATANPAACLQPPASDAERLRFLHRFVNVADHVERLLRQVVVLAVNEFLEAADGIFDRHVLAGLARELLGHAEGLATGTVRCGGRGRRPVCLRRKARQCRESR